MRGHTERAARTLNVARGLRLPLESVTQTFGVIAKRGMGKTYTGNVLAEEMLAAGQVVVVLDPVGVWWGLRSSASGKGPGMMIAVLGGDHGDVPLPETAGAVIADLVVEQRLSMVLDLSLLRKGQAQRFVLEFAERLYHRNRSPVHVMLDEADAFAPQRPAKGTERLLGAIEDLVRRGRARGIGVSLFTQRAAVLNKNVLTQIETLVALRVTSPQDRAALDDWIRQHAEEEQREVFLASIASLPVGTAWFWSPGWLGVFQRVEVRKRRTFDSSATPEVGGNGSVVPAVLAPVDLEALRERMAATIERAEQDDPRLLRARIRELEGELSRRSEAVPVVERVEVEVPVLGPDEARMIAEVGDAIEAGADRVVGVMREVLDRLAERPLPAAKDRPALLPPEPRRRVSEAEAAEMNRQHEAALRGRSGVVLVEGDEPALRAGALRILEALARHHPMRFTKAQVGTLTGFKVSGGTFQTYWGVLRRAGYIDESGDDFGVTQAGLDRAGVVPERPATTEEMVEMWGSRLRKGAREMLDALVAVYPARLSREGLARQVGMTATGGTFQTYLGTLRRNGLVVVASDGCVGAAETLFIGGASR